MYWKKSQLPEWVVAHSLNIFSRDGSTTERGQHSIINWKSFFIIHCCCFAKVYLILSLVRPTLFSSDHISSQQWLLDDTFLLDVEQLNGRKLVEQPVGGKTKAKAGSDMLET